jgi:hypothetical protein
MKKSQWLRFRSQNHKSNIKSFEFCALALKIELCGLNSREENEQVTITD